METSRASRIWMALAILAGMTLATVAVIKLAQIPA